MKNTTQDTSGLVERMRHEVKALARIQLMLTWYIRNHGEPSIMAQTYQGREALFSRESVFHLAEATAVEADPDRRRALQFFKGYLAGEFIAMRLAPLEDEVQNAQRFNLVTLDWLQQPIPYRKTLQLLAHEQDPERRVRIEQARAELWRTRVNPTLLAKEALAQELAATLGYPSYVEAAQDILLVDLRALILEGARFLEATDARYQALLEQVAARQLKLPASAVRYADTFRLRKAPGFQRYFPQALAVPAFEHFLSGIGLDLTTAAGSRIRIDETHHDGKDPRAFCCPVHIPDDIRISVMPTDGIDDFAVLFHEGGHALHQANTATPVWEFQYLGPRALTEGLAMTFAHVWDDPHWLRRYRRFVLEWNDRHHTHFPVMTDEEILELCRTRVFDVLFNMRRVAFGKLVYEAILHRGNPEVWLEAYAGPTDDLPEVYRSVFSRAYGFPLEADDILRYLVDVDDMFYAADYARAFGLSHLIHEALAGRFGPDWYGDPAVGALLRERLFKHGHKYQADEVAELFGYPRLDYRPLEARLERLLAV